MKDRSEYFSSRTALRRKRYMERKQWNKDIKPKHHKTATDTDILCEHHGTPLKRYVMRNKQSLKEYPFYRCNHCMSQGMPSYYPEKYFTERLEK